jgi:hypothetical protein
LHALEIRHLLRCCEKYDLDSQEIDPSLTYWENKRHLVSLVYGSSSDAEWDSRLEQFKDEHLLSDYIMATLEGETQPEITTQIMNEMMDYVQQKLQGRGFPDWAVDPLSPDSQAAHIVAVVLCNYSDEWRETADFYIGYSRHEPISKKHFSLQAFIELESEKV